MLASCLLEQGHQCGRECYGTRRPSEAKVQRIRSIVCKLVDLRDYSMQEIKCPAAAASRSRIPVWRFSLEQQSPAHHHRTILGDGFPYWY